MMINLETEIKDLQAELSDKEIKKLLNKLLKTKYQADVITKQEYKTAKKMVKELLK